MWRRFGPRTTQRHHRTRLGHERRRVRSSSTSQKPASQPPLNRPITLRAIPLPCTFTRMGLLPLRGKRQDSRLSQRAQSMRQRRRQRIRPGPGREQRAHRRYRAVEGWPALTTRLHEEDEQPAARPQPAAQLGLVGRPEWWRQRAQAALSARSSATTSKPAASSAAGSGLFPAPGTTTRHGASIPKARQARNVGFSSPRSHGVRPSRNRLSQKSSGSPLTPGSPQADATRRGRGFVRPGRRRTARARWR